MRDIRELIDELREHPDLVNNIGFLPIFTMDDILYELNEQLKDFNLNELTEVNYDDLTDNDMKFIREHFYHKIEELWDNCGFRLLDLPDLPKKIKRDIKISKILKNKNEI
jgi:hypothetical protein